MQERPNILAIAAGQAGLSEEAVASVRKWLMAQLLANAYAKLSQGGHKDDNVALRQVFVDLPLESDDYGLNLEPQYFLTKFLAAEPLDLKKAMRGGQGLEAMPDEREARRAMRAEFSANILIGGPGQGKSTLGQLACQLQRAALLTPLLTQLSSDSQRELVRSFDVAQERKNSKKGQDQILALPRQVLLPLQISLPDFSAWLSKLPADSGREDLAAPGLLRFLAAQPGARQSGLQVSSLSALCAQMPVLLVLDGFDEVGDNEDRQALVAAGKELLEHLASLACRVKIIAATRPQGYGGELAQMGLPMAERVLAPLSLQRARNYAGKLVAAKVQDADLRQKLMERLDVAAQDKNTQRLLTTPLQVTIMTALVQQYGRAPRERWPLFHKYYTYTFDREIERNTYASDLLHEHRARIDKIHCRVALLLQLEAERAGGGAARMPRTKLVEVIQTVLEEDEIAAQDQDDLGQAIAKAAEQRLVFLVEPEPGLFGFEIRSLQEFMAAWALTTGREEIIKARLAQIAAAPMFRNVALFIASRWYSEDNPMADVFEQEMCRNLEQGAENAAACITHAGATFALGLLEEGVALSQPRRARALMQTAVGLLKLPPSREHVRLAHVVSRETEAVLQPVLAQYLDQPKDGNCYSAWICVLAGCAREAAWAKRLGEEYWRKLPDITQLLDYVANVRIGISDWLAKMIEPAIAQLSPEIFLNIDSGQNRHWSAAVARFYASDDSYHPDNWIRFNRVGLVSERKRIQLPPVPECQWHAWYFAVEYECFQNANSLAQALEKIAETLPLENWPALARRSSWPLAVCLLTANDRHDLLRYAKLALAGDLGDVGDWLDAQALLDVFGVTNFPFPLTCLDDLPELWTVQSLREFPPLLAVNELMFSVDCNQSIIHALPALKKLNLAFKDCPYEKLKCRLADFCILFFHCLDQGEDIAEFDPLLWLNANPENPVALVPRPKVLSHQDWLYLLAQSSLPRRAFVHDAYYTSQMGQVLIAASLHPVALRAASLIGRFVARNLNHFARLLDWEKFASALERFQTSNATERAEIAIWQALLGTLPTDRDASFPVDLAEALVQTPMLLEFAVSALNKGRLPAERATTILLAIYQHLGAAHQHADELINAIRQHQMAHKSGLEKPETWHALDLPPPAPEAAPNTKVVQTPSNIIPAQAVHLQSLEVKNIRGLHHLSFQFHCPEPNQGQWIVLLGPNGVGKTTLLRSLALSLRNVKDPAIWPQNAFNPWRKAGSEAEVALISVGTARQGLHTSRLAAEANHFEQIPEQKAQPLFPLFAYGCRRGSALGGAKPQSLSEESNGQEIATLFDEDADLLHAETWLISLEGDTQRNPQSKLIYEVVLNAMKTLLNVAAVEVENRRVMVTEHDRARLPLNALSDGYLTSAGWFLDLIARWLDLAMRHDVAVGVDFMQTMRGLVLIDEIDLHLHPQWQIEIIARTRELLPQMSFVVTTHNPLTLVGAQAQEIWILENRQGQILATQCEETPMLLTGGQLYRRYFGIADIYPKGLGRDMERYTFLANYALRTDAEQAELESLGEKLRAAKLEPDVEVVEREFLEPHAAPAAKKRAPRKTKKVVP